jgi:hypothetical protein
MRVAVMTKRRSGFVEVLEACARRDGHDLESFDLADLAVDDRLAAFDLVVLKSKHLYFLYAGFHAQALGAQVVPDPWISKQVSTRIEMPFLAQRAGIATPRFWFAAPDVVREQLPASRFPLVRKRIVGSGSAGVELIESKDALPETTDRHLYLEECIPGPHMAVYFIEGDIAAFGKRPFASGREPVEAIAAADDVASAVGRWRRTTGLAFGKLDFVRDARTGALVLVDAGSFPQFRHWPGAAERVSALLLGPLCNRAA